MEGHDPGKIHHGVEEAKFQSGHAIFIGPFARDDGDTSQAIVQVRNEIGVDHLARRRVVFANRSVAFIRDKKVPSRYRDARRTKSQPRDQRGFIGAPVLVSYSPIFWPLKLVT